MNPATYLRVNGPEPWNVCYVEPSIRPDDSRYGLNPNRLQRHTQVTTTMPATTARHTGPDMLCMTTAPELLSADGDTVKSLPHSMY